MEKVTSSEATQEALESRIQQLFSLAILNDKRLANNSIEILSGMQTYYKDVYLGLQARDCTETRPAIDSQDSSERSDRFEQLRQRLVDLHHSLGLLRVRGQALDLVDNDYESSLMADFIRMSKMYCSFLEYEKETCKIVLDIWNLIQALDESSFVDHDDYFTHVSYLYKKIDDGFNIHIDFVEDDLYVELESLAENGNYKAGYLCERLRIASYVPYTQLALIDRIRWALEELI